MRSAFVVCLDSIILLVSIPEISRPYLDSVAEQDGSSLPGQKSRRQVFSWRGSYLPRVNNSAAVLIIISLLNKAQNVSFQLSAVPTPNTCLVSPNQQQPSWCCSPKRCRHCSFLIGRAWSLIGWNLGDYFQVFHGWLCLVKPGRLGVVLPRSVRSQTTSLFFKVTPANWMSNFDPKMFVCTLSLENKDGFWPKLGQLKDLMRFWWPWPNFQGHLTMKTVKVSLVYTLLPEPINGFWLNLHTIGTRKRSD